MTRTIYFAGGCFWGVEKYFALIAGVEKTRVGYANGRTENPTYEQVCKEGTGHAEAVEVCYDPGKASLPFLLARYFEIIDPVSINRQGGDIGEQYRTGVYYVEEGDAQAIRDALSALEKAIGQPVSVECAPLDQFFAAEEYHQQYLDKNPGGYCHIPKVKFEDAKERWGSA